MDTLILQPFALADAQRLSVEQGLDSLARDRVEGSQPLDAQPFIAGPFHDGLCKRMLGPVFRGGSQGEQGILGQALGDDIGDGRPAACDGAGFVEYHRGHMLGGLEGLTALDEDTVFRALPRGRHDGCRGGETEGTGAGDDQYRDEDGEHESGRLTVHCPVDGSDGCQADDDRHKPA